MSLQSQPIKLPGINTIIAVMSGKGGVGKTFVAANLAATFKKLGKRVGILDADVGSPSMFKMLGVTKKITPTADNKIIPIEQHGMKIVSMAGLCATETEPIMWRGPILSKIIQQLLKETMWGELDVLVIDFPTGTSDIALTLLKNFKIDGVITVTTPDQLAANETARTINATSELQVPVIGILENMRGDIFGEGGASRIAEALHTPFLGSIPMRKQIVSYSNEGEPAVYHMEELEILFSKVVRLIVEGCMPVV